MKRNRIVALGVGASIALLAAGAALAQYVTPTLVTAVSSADLFQDIPNGASASTNVYASVLQMRSFVLGQGSQHLAAPTLTTTTTVCGGSTATVNGTDTSGQIAEGSSASTSCVVTFAKAFTTAPSCFVSIDNVADTALKCAATTTGLTITQSSLASGKLNYLVVGQAGG